MLARVAMVCCLAALAIAGPQTKLAEDPPLARAPANGTLSGVVRPAPQAAAVKALSRTTRQSYSPASFDKTTGKFLFKDLPGDASYDLSITTTDGRTVEGIDLEMPDARLARLAEERRKQLNLPPPRRHTFSSDDANEILQYVAKMEDFMDIRRTLYVQGHGTGAAALVELVRTKEYYAAKPGELIWRVELWYFQNSFGGWERVPDTERVLRRERIGHEKWTQLDVTYYPELSAYVDATGFAKSVDFTLPEKPDPSRGRLRNTKPEQDTPPHVSGLDAKDDASSQPAPPPAATQPAAGGSKAGS